MCPYKWSSKEFKNPNGFYLSTYKGIRIKWKYEAYGCSKKLKQTQLRNHQLNCKFQPHENNDVKTVNCEGCKFDIDSSELAHHSCVSFLGEKVKSQQNKIDSLEKNWRELLKWYQSIQDYLSIIDSQIGSQHHFQKVI